jgi:hypothetical protein
MDAMVLKKSKDASFFEEKEAKRLLISGGWAGRHAWACHHSQLVLYGP